MNELIMPHNVGVKNALEKHEGVACPIQECDKQLSPIA